MSCRIWILSATAALAACSPAASTTTPADAAAAARATPPAATSTPVSEAVALPAGVSIDKAAPAKVGMTVSGEIVPNGPSHFYRFDNPLTQRDIILMRMENKSATLKPEMKIYDADRSEIVDKYDATPGASVQQLISLEPGRGLYVEVKPYGSAGAYQLSAIAQKSYDAHEPNDDQLSPTAVSFGQTIEGSIMDGRDHDWFRVSGATAATINVVLDNQSTTLKPNVRIYSSTKSQKREEYDATPGAGLDFKVDIDVGKDFYVQVLPYASMGKYRLSFRAAQ
jgi:hypothetical protein